MTSSWQVQGKGVAGTCDADDAPVLPQVYCQQLSEEPANWDLRQAHIPWQFVSNLRLLGRCCVWVLLGALRMLATSSRFTHRAVLSTSVQIRESDLGLGCVCIVLYDGMNSTETVVIHCLLGLCFTLWVAAIESMWTWF